MSIVIEAQCGQTITISAGDACECSLTVKVVCTETASPTSGDTASFDWQFCGILIIVLYFFCYKSRHFRPETASSSSTTANPAGRAEKKGDQPTVTSSKPGQARRRGRGKGKRTTGAINQTRSMEGHYNRPTNQEADDPSSNMHSIQSLDSQGLRRVESLGASSLDTNTSSLTTTNPGVQGMVRGGPTHSCTNFQPNFRGPDTSDSASARGASANASNAARSPLVHNLEQCVFDILNKCLNPDQNAMKKNWRNIGSKYGISNIDLEYIADSFPTRKVQRMLMDSSEFVAYTVEQLMIDLTDFNRSDVVEKLNEFGL